VSKILKQPWILIDTERVVLCREPEGTWWLAYDNWLHEASNPFKLAWSVLTEFKSDKHR